MTCLFADLYSKPHHLLVSDPLTPACRTLTPNALLSGTARDDRPSRAIDSHGLPDPDFRRVVAAEPIGRDIATELLVRLEDRRVLYNPSTAEVPSHCIQSVIEVRHLLSDALAKAGGDGLLAAHVRALGAACRRFLDRVNVGGEDAHEAMRSHGHYLSWEFLDALGQLRGIFGVHVALIAAEFDLEVDGDLQDILPPQPTDRDFSR